MKKKKRKELVAEAILKTVCSTMKTKAYAFIPIINIMKFQPIEESLGEYLLGTDGEVIFYNAKRIIRAAKEKDLLRLEMTLFHIIFHGMLGHFEQTEWEDKGLAWVVQDMQVTRCMKMIYSDEELDLCWQGFPQLLENYIGDELYFKGRKLEGLRESILEDADVYAYDDHRRWNPMKVKVMLMDEDDLQGEEGEKGSFWQMAGKLILGVGKKDVAVKENMIIDLLSKSKGDTKRHGKGSSNYENEVEYVKSKNSYRELLQKITSIAERVLEEQELDKVLYQYGLELYGDVPIVEPEEITEKHCLNTLVIAVDTSGSCTNIAQQFYEELLVLLDEIKQIGSIKHICYLECDSEIKKQEDCYSIENFLEFGKRHKFFGGGGTDFRPVFEHVDSLVTAGEQVDALIYITDAMGDFPDEKPDYPTYLLLDYSIEGDIEYIIKAYVPDWAEYIVMDAEKGNDS